MNYIIRKIREDEYYLLDDFIYEAIFIPEGVDPPPKSIINQPDLQVYIKDFGTQKDDICFVAQADNKVIGAVWVRDMQDYGHIADGVPSFAISLYKEYRNSGIGTKLMQTMLRELKSRGYKRASLAVQKENYAVRMYKKVGFEIFDENNEEYIMICDLMQHLAKTV
ncbi:MAG: GNAT family N-acetyltransferase [Ruminococcus sp.]|nr:GNAT family N-acetyltransferase [Ruminococcus sp.]